VPSDAERVDVGAIRAELERLCMWRYLAALDQQQREIERLTKAERNTRAEWEGSLGTYPDGDGVPDVVTLSAMTRELVADLASAKAQNHEWLVCNGPGGWIDDLRKDVASAKAEAESAKAAAIESYDLMQREVAAAKAALAQAERALQEASGATVEQFQAVEARAEQAEQERDRLLGDLANYENGQRPRRNFTGDDRFGETR
jgi:hypothetical protein